MRLIFFCGCLEQGKDGVGDYVRRLANHISGEHQVCLISLNDGYVKDNFQESIYGRITVLRISSQLSSSKSNVVVKRYLTEFIPDVVSLQFVPYSFDKKGLPVFFLFRFRKFMNHATSAKWHIMFHELWLGINKEISLKERIIGILQRGIIKLTIDVVNPFLITTSIAIYQRELKRLCKKSVVLTPLFSNIACEAMGIRKELELKSNEFKIACFGSIYSRSQFAAFLEELHDFSQTNTERRYKFVFVGRNGNTLENWKQLLKSRNIEYEVLGEQSEFIISSVLNNCQVGITTTHKLLAGKSGTIAAMAMTGLPIVSVANTWTPVKEVREDRSYPSVFQYEKGNLKSFLNNIENYSLITSNTVELVADTFLNYWV